MARLVPATCPKCGANVRLDPDKEFVTCTYCGASSFVQTQRRPVTQQVVQQHLPVIHVTRRQSGCVSALIALGVLAGVGGAIAGIVLSLFATTATQVTVTPPSAPFKPGAAEPSAAVASPAPTGPLIQQDYFLDTARVKQLYEEKLGKPIFAKELVVYQFYALLEAQDPKNKAHVDRYRLWASRVERPEPVRLGTEKAQLGALLFSLDDVNFAIVPSLVKRAASELKVEDGKPTHLYLERSGAGAEPIWRVYVNGPRDSGFVEFDQSGATKRVAN